MADTRLPNAVRQILDTPAGEDVVMPEVAPITVRTQDEVSLDGRSERVGFYNTFVGRVGGDTALPSGVSVDADPATGDVHHVRGPHFRGIQFHAESILTQHGADLIHRLAADLLA